MEKIFNLIKYNDYLNNKYDEIHKQLYEAALENFIIDNKNEIFVKNNIKYIELQNKNDKYNTPSKLLILYINDNNIKCSIIKSLSKYWPDTSQYMYNDIDKIKVCKNKIKDAKMININYVLGEITFESDLNGVIYTVPFNKINK